VRAEGRTAGYELSGKGRLLLRGKETFMGTRGSGLRAPRSAPGEQPGPAGPGGGGEPDVPATESLFQALRQVRRQIAEAKGLPAYVVFSDRTLRAIARAQPTSAASLRRCPGVGDAKLEAYGALFLRAVQEFRDRSGLS